KSREALVFVAVDRAVAGPDPDGAVRSLGQRAHVTAIEAVFWTEYPARRAIESRQSVLCADPHGAGAIDEERLDAMNARIRASTGGAVEGVQIFVPCAHPQPAARRGKNGEHESAGRAFGERYASEDAIAIALQASSHRSHPDRAGAVFDHGRSRGRPE